MALFVFMILGLLHPEVAGGGHIWVITINIWDSPKDTSCLQHNGKPCSCDLLNAYWEANKADQGRQEKVLY